MVKVKVTIFPGKKEVWVPRGETLYKALLIAGYVLEASCGGIGVCGKCKVKVLAEKNSQEITEESITVSCNKGKNHLEFCATEWQQLSLAEIQQGYRLACQVVLENDLQVWVPPELQEVSVKNLQVGAIEEGISFSLSSLVQKVFLQLPRPSLKDYLGDWERIERGLLEKGFFAQSDQTNPCLQVDGEVLWKISKILRDSNYAVTAVLYDGKLITVEEGDTTSSKYGVALDLGTTTMMGMLIDLYTGQQLAVAGLTNPQKVFGADVISRISFGSRGKKNLLELQSRLVDAVNQIIDDLTAQAGIDRSHIYEIVAAGNTAIHHLFLGLDPTYLGQGPHVPVVTSPLQIKVRRLRIHMCDSGYLYLLPNIAGFVGGDAVGLILSTGLDQSSKICLAVDIGTNGEIALGWAQQILVCSTAAGPAFEGARIKHGMRAESGAIAGVVIDEDVRLTVIGSEEPLGIAGSGLIDAAAEMLRMGIMDYTGRIFRRQELPEGLPSRVKERVVEYNGRPEFILAWGERDGEKSKLISITQEDIRELQLAKGAIAAGIKVLEKELGITTEQIAQGYLAGAFGSCINLSSAQVIGLIPGLDRERIKVVGNAAGAGAYLALVSQAARKQAAQVAREVRYIELSDRTDFQEAFLESMYFPKPV